MLKLRLLVCVIPALGRNDSLGHDLHEEGSGDLRVEGHLGGCGIAVESLHDLKAEIDNLSDTDYQDLVENAKRVGQEIREGRYLKTALASLT